MARAFFFFNDTATTEIYTLSLHDALPIWRRGFYRVGVTVMWVAEAWLDGRRVGEVVDLVSRAQTTYPVAELRRSEEHTSELQSRQYLVCRLLLEKKKTYKACVVTCTKTKT